MKHFLVVFDRVASHVLVEREFADHREALTERFAVEREHAGNPAIEVVVLTADSSDALRRTHARYFQRLAELAREAVGSAESA